MLKILIQAAVIAAFAFAASVAGLSAWRSFHNHEQHTTNESSTEKSAQEGNNTAPASGTEEKPEQATARYNMWLMIFTGALAFVALLQIGFMFSADTTAIKTASAAKNSADALIAGQRAFVYWGEANFRIGLKAPMAPIKHGRYAVLETPHEKNAEIGIDLTNGGGTTTRGLRSIFACEVVSFDKIPEEPFSLFQWDEQRALPNVIAPKQTVPIQPCEVTIQDIEFANNNGRAIFLLGEVRYADLVDHKTVRRIQFARRVRVTDFDEKAGTFSATAYAVGQHNCADDECPD